MISIFQSIEQTIERGRESLGKNLFRWNLPRQCGVTTWMLRQVTNDLDAGLHVAFAIYGSKSEFLSRFPHLKYFVGNKQLILLTEGSNPIATRGLTLDRLYADNVKYWRIDKQQDLFAAVLPAVSTNGFSVFIDTTEG